MASSDKIRVVQYGLGAIGLLAAKTILGRRELELVGAIDLDPMKLERDVADLSGLRRPSGIRVSNRPREVLGVNRPQVVLHTTQSSLEEVLPQLGHCLEVGASVVSTCEELLLPGPKQLHRARQLDQQARAKGSVILGTGVNPGFAMDTMAVAASAPCLEVRAVRVERVVDASAHRESLQRKAGAGLTEAECRRGIKNGDLGHKGLLESLHFIAQGIGWSLDKVTESVAPVVANRTLKTSSFTIKKGQVAGIHHVGRGYVERRQVIHLDLQTVVGAKNPVDRITITGTPDVHLVFDGGVAGDEATVGMLLNMVPAVVAAKPGLRTMMDMPVPRFRAGN